MGGKKKGGGAFTVEDFRLDFDKDWDEVQDRYLKKVEAREVLSFEAAKRRKQARIAQEQTEAEAHHSNILEALKQWTLVAEVNAARTNPPPTEV